MTGWPPGLLQDDSRELSKWLADRLGARRQLKEQYMHEVDLTASVVASVADKLAGPTIVWTLQSDNDSGCEVTVHDSFAGARDSLVHILEEYDEENSQRRFQDAQDALASLAHETDKFSCIVGDREWYGIEPNQVQRRSAKSSPLKDA